MYISCATATSCNPDAQHLQLILHVLTHIHASSMKRQAHHLDVKSLSSITSEDAQRVYHSTSRVTI
jgi:indole-3-glycerol phosphate synthase